MRNEQPHRPLDARLREDALDVLRDAMEWRLTARRWITVADALARLDAALLAGDPDAVRERVYELELSGPVRATGIQEDPTVDPPEPVRPRLNALVRAFEQDALDEDEVPAQPQADG